MKIEAVVVCHNYADFLEHTLPENIELLDRLVIVTHYDDKRTQQLAARFGAHCVETDVFHNDGDVFNKARAINLGLQHLRHEDWLLHLDADIVLPHRFREMLRHAKLNPQDIYGADRQNTQSYDNWEAHKHRTVPQHQWRYLVNPIAEFPLGSRLLHQDYGYCPIGYFQLWHAGTKRIYPTVSGSAEHSDVLFAVQWPREKRHLLPEFFVYHLESDGSAPMGINWKGRKTPPFGPKHHHHHRPPHCHHPHHCRWPHCHCKPYCPK